MGVQDKAKTKTVRMRALKRRLISTEGVGEKNIPLRRAFNNMVLCGGASAKASARKLASAGLPWDYLRRVSVRLVGRGGGGFCVVGRECAVEYYQGMDESSGKSSSSAYDNASDDDEDDGWVETTAVLNKDDTYKVKGQGRSEPASKLRRLVHLEWKPVGTRKWISEDIKVARFNSEVMYLDSFFYYNSPSSSLIELARKHGVRTSVLGMDLLKKLAHSMKFSRIDLIDAAMVPGVCTYDEPGESIYSTMNIREHWNKYLYGESQTSARSSSFYRSQGFEPINARRIQVRERANNPQSMISMSLMALNQVKARVVEVSKGGRACRIRVRPGQFRNVKLGAIDFRKGSRVMVGKREGIISNIARTARGAVKYNVRFGIGAKLLKNADKRQVKPVVGSLVLHTEPWRDSLKRQYELGRALSKQESALEKKESADDSTDEYSDEYLSVLDNAERACRGFRTMANKFYRAFPLVKNIINNDNRTMYYMLPLTTKMSRTRALKLFDSKGNPRSFEDEIVNKFMA